MATPIYTLITAQHVGPRGPLPANILRTPLRSDHRAALALLHQSTRRTQRAHLVHPPDDERRLVAIAALLSLEFPALILTPSEQRAQQWQRCVQRNTEAIRGDTDTFFSLDVGVPAQIICLPYHALRDHPELQDRVSEQTFRTLVLDDAHVVQRPIGRLVEELASALDEPVILGLSDGVPRPASLHTRSRLQRLVGEQRVTLDVAARVRERALVPFTPLAWCVELDAEARERLDAFACELEQILTTLRAESPHCPDLDAWIRRRLVAGMTQTDGHKSFGDFLVRQPEEACALMRAHLTLGLSPPAECWTLEAMRRPLSWEAWGPLLLDFSHELEPFDHPEAERRVELIARYLRHVGLIPTRDQSLIPVPAPLQRLVTGARSKLEPLDAILTRERQARPLRAVILVGDEREPPADRFDLSAAHAPACFDAFDVARGLDPAHRAAVLQPDALWLHPDDATRARALLSTIDARAELDDDAAALQDGLLPLRLSPTTASLQTLASWAVLCLERGVFSTLVTTPAYLDTTQPCPRLTTLIDLTADGDRGPTPIHAAHNLLTRASSGEPRDLNDGLVNVWTLFALDPHRPLGRRDLDGLKARLDAVPGLDRSGHIQLGPGALHPLFERDDAPELIFEERERLNHDALERAARPRRNLEGWSIGLPYKARLAPALDVFRVGATQPALTRLAVPHHVGATTSPTRARRRRFFFLEYRRHILAQALVFGTTGCLTLPLVAGPLLGSLVALLYTLLIVVITRRHLRALQRVHLLAPERDDVRVLDIARVVLRTLRDCEGIRQRDLPSSLLRVEDLDTHALRIWLDTDDRRLASRFNQALEEALNPLSDQRYIISRPITRMPLRTRHLKRSLDLEIASYHPVPSLFGRNRQTAELFAGHWGQTMGPGKLRYACGGKGRLMRHIHFAQRSLGFIAHTIQRWR